MKKTPTSICLIIVCIVIGFASCAQKPGEFTVTSNINDSNENTTNMKKIIATNDAPAAIGPYSQAVETNGMIFVSGQLPIDPATGEFVEGGIKEQTEQSFKNINAILTECGLTTDNIVKTTVLLSDMADFAGMNEVYSAQFSGTFPARSTFAVKELPKKSLVEIEVIVIR